MRATSVRKGSQACALRHGHLGSLTPATAPATSPLHAFTEESATNKPQSKYSQRRKGSGLRTAVLAPCLAPEPALRVDPLVLRAAFGLPLRAEARALVPLRDTAT